MSENECEKDCDSQESFVDILKDYPVIFNKSQLPECKARKVVAIKEVKSLCLEKLGIDLNEQQITKKVFHMKSRLKNRTDMKMTGNKKINLKCWEKKLYDLMNGDSNPSVSRLQGSVSAGVREAQETCVSENATWVTQDTETNRSSSSICITKTKPKKIKNIESEETKDLSNAELQRRVLLKQLSVYTLKEEKLLREKRQAEEKNQYCEVLYSEEV